MIVFKRIPFWPSDDFLLCRRFNDNFVSIKFSIESSAVQLTHVAHLILNQLVTLVVDTFDELVCVRWITNALEEFDALLTLKLFKLAVLLNEVLLVNREFHTLQVVQDRCLHFFIGFHRHNASEPVFALNRLEVRLGCRHVAGEAQLRLAVALVAKHVGIDASIAAARGLPEAHRAIGLPRAHLQKRLRLIGLASQVRCLVLFIDDIEALLEGAAAHRAIGASSDVCVLGRT